MNKLWIEANNAIEQPLVHEQRNLRLCLALAAYLLVSTVILYLFFSSYAYDDPFITFRYAENLASGKGFVYNPGEKVLSTTTPLFALVLGVLAKLGGQPYPMSLLLGAFSLSIGGLFIWGIAQEFETPEAGWAGLALFPFFPMVVNTLGSEVPLYIALAVGAIYFYIRQNFPAAAALAGLVVLVRPDGILVAVVLGAHFLLLVRRPIPWKAVLIFLGITLSWLLFAWIYFGSPIPVTLAAKRQQGEMAITESFFRGFFTTVKSYTSWPYRLEAVLAFFGLYFFVRSGRRWGLFLAWIGLYFAAYSFLGVGRYFWYYSALVPGFIALVGLGVSWLHRRVSGWGGRTAYYLAFLLPAVLVAASLYGQWRSLNFMRLNPSSRNAAYREVGEWLNTHTAPQDRVGALEVGIIGYYARRPMIDFAGLIQPAVARQFSVDATYEDAALFAVDYYRPEYLVLHDGIFPRLEGTLDGKCHPVQSFLGVNYGYSLDLLVYDCR